MMFIKYRDSETLHPIEAYQFINNERVRLIGKNIPISTSGFDVYSDDFTGMSKLYLNPLHTVVYEQTAEYVEMTTDTNVYNVSCIYDPETLYVVRQVVTANKEYPNNSILVSCGKGKAFHNPQPVFEYKDNHGLFNYRIDSIEDLNIVKVSDEEKQLILEQRADKAFKDAVSRKLSEIAKTCKAKIETGTDYNGVHFSYTIEDQTNIKSALELAVATNLDAPYHADGYGCQLFTKEDLTSIYVINQTNLTHSQTYSNQLKMYIKEQLTTVEEINSIRYGQPLTGKYLETYQEIMMQSKKIIAKYLNVTEEAVDAILSGIPVLSTQSE